LLPPWIPENEKFVALRLMVGAEDVVGATVDVVGVSSWVSPGMVVNNFCRPRPLLELPAAMDEPAAAMPDKGDEVAVVDVGLERAPASDKELVVVVVVLVGVLLEVVPVRVVALLVCVVVELSVVVVGALSSVEVDDVVVSVRTEARRGDFLMSLWGFRIDVESLVESVLAVLRSEVLAFSWPKTINGSPIAWV
jgi:hypothetical protein